MARWQDAGPRNTQRGTGRGHYSTRIGIDAADALTYGRSWRGARLAMAAMAGEDNPWEKPSAEPPEDSV